MVPISEGLRSGQQRIGNVDARVLLSHVLGCDSAFLIAHFDELLSEEQHRRYLALVTRRELGEPVAYLTGEREFYGRPYKVSPAVLIPRPETELLVEHALKCIPTEQPARVLDLGTGSGCVAISIASERSHAKIIAVDQSTEALAVAKDNAGRLGRNDIVFMESNWYSAMAGQQFDVIVSNPPYVADNDAHLLGGDLRFEPRAALAGGPDGLHAIRRIIVGARGHVKPGGWLLLEHGHDQADATRAFFKAAGYQDVFSASDLAGIERVTGARLTLLPAGR